MTISLLTRKSTYTPGASAPDWFKANLNHAYTSNVIEINGRNSHFLSWNWEEKDLPALVLVHGYRGHAHWWSYLAPFFLETHRVAALELSGMGSSSHLPNYNKLTFSDDILGFAEYFNLKSATFVAHSFGGAHLLKACARSGNTISHAVIVDTYVNFPDTDNFPQVPPLAKLKMHPTREAAAARFRLEPPQDNVIQDLFHYIAHHSVQQTKSGWCWKFDPALTNFEEINGPDMLSRINSKVDYVYGDQSLVVTKNRARNIFKLIPGGRHLIEMPGAHHHIMLDQPLELVDVIKRCLL